MEPAMYSVVVRECLLRRLVVLSLFAAPGVDARGGCPRVALGLPAGSSLVFKDSLILGAEDMSLLLGVDKSRLADAPQLDDASAERLKRCARLFAGALDVLADRDAAVRWLKSPQPELGGLVPLCLARTQAGTWASEATLDEIRSGIRDHPPRVVPTLVC